MHDRQSRAQDLDAGLCFISQDGRTALISASEEGHLEVVKAMLAAGADMEAVDEVGGARGHRHHRGFGDNKCDRGMTDICGVTCMHEGTHILLLRTFTW